MKKVNIYLMQSIKGPREKKGKGCYLLEMERDGKEPVTLSKTVEINGTENHVSTKLLLESLKRLNTGCNLHIYTEQAYIASALGGWMDKWWKAGWKNAKGEDVLPEWREIAEILVGNEVTVHLQEEHSYKAWMKGEIKNV